MAYPSLTIAMLLKVPSLTEI